MQYFMEWVPPLGLDWRRTLFELYGLFIWCGIVADLQLLRLLGIVFAPEVSSSLMRPPSEPPFYEAHRGSSPKWNEDPGCSGIAGATITME